MLPHIIDEQRDSGLTYRYIINEVNSQRNGVSGEGFFVVKFSYMEIEKDGGIGSRDELMAVMFNDPSRTAIIDPNDLNSHWRGDMFAPTLREALTVIKGYNVWE